MVWILFMILWLMVTILLFVASLVFAQDKLWTRAGGLFALFVGSGWAWIESFGALLKWEV